MASSIAAIENQIKGLFTELWVEFNEVEIKQGMGPYPGVGCGREPHLYTEGSRRPPGGNLRWNHYHNLSFLLSSDLQAWKEKEASRTQRT